MQWINGSDNVKRKRNGISMGYIVLLALMIIFFIRAGSVLNSYRERGGLAYVQLLNYSMPVVETQIYDSTAYRENKVTIKRVIIEALGLNKITTYGIIGNEVSFFSNINKVNSNGNLDNSSKSAFNLFEPYVVKEESIARVTEEDLAELNKTSAAYDPSLKKTLDASNVEILIYHTHTHEGYAEAGSDTDQEEFSVVGVGDVLAQELEEGYGISVIHDKTLHDVDYNGCYLRSRDTVQNYLNQYGDFKLIIDLHRDSSANRDNVATTLNGESLAKFMFVIGQSSPKLEQNQALVNNLIDITNRLFPSLLRTEYNGGTFVYDTSYGTFNLGLSNNMLLVEDGGVGNTAQEAKLTAKYIARVIAEYINRQ